MLVAQSLEAANNPALICQLEVVRLQLVNGNPDWYTIEQLFYLPLRKVRAFKASQVSLGGRTRAKAKQHL